MTVDTRCTVICDQGITLSGSLSEDHIDTSNALAKVQGSIVLSGIRNIARGTVVNLAYQVPGYAQVTRFPRRLRVLGCQVDPFEEVTTLQVGCLLSLKQDLKPREKYKAIDYPAGWFTALPERMRPRVPLPVYAQGILSHCLGRMGITAAAGNVTLTSAQLREDYDLSSGYVQTINDLLISEGLYGFINAAEQFVVRRIRPSSVTGPVLTRDALLTLEGIESGAQPADRIEVEWDRGVEAPEGITFEPVPVLPELPSTPGGPLVLTPAQEEEKEEVLADLQREYGLSEREAEGVFNKALIDAGAEPDENGDVDPTDEEFTQAIEYVGSYGRGYWKQKERVADYERSGQDALPSDPAGLDPSGAEANPTAAKPLRDWTTDITIGSEQTYRVKYFPLGTGDVPIEEAVTHTPTSTTETTYETKTYYDQEGVQRSEDVVVKRETTTTTCIGAANPTRWKSKREYDAEARPADTLTRRSVTFYAYVATADGMRTIRERVREYEPKIAFAAGLGIQNWRGIDLGYGEVLRSETLTEYFWDDKDDRTKTIVSRWLAWGATQEGATGLAAIAKVLEERYAYTGLAQAPTEYIAAIDTLVSYATELIFDGSETRISIGRGNVESRPSAQARAVEELQRDPLTGTTGDRDGASYSDNDGAGWPMGENLPDNPTGTSPGGRRRVALDLRSGDPGEPDDPEDPNDPAGTDPLPNRTDTYTLPFPADDVLEAAVGQGPGAGDPVSDAFDDTTIELTVSKGKVQDQARQFARLMNYLAYGHAGGVAITTEIRNLPTEPLGTIFIDAAGVAGAFRCNGTSWAWGGDGMIVGTDALIHGVAGKIGSPAFTDAWVPVPVALASLAAAPATSSNANPKPANTITTPNGFDPLNPTGLWALLPTNGSDAPAVQRTATAVVEPRNERLPLVARSRSKVRLVGFDYVLNLGSETLRIESRTTVRSVTEVAVPVAGLLIAGQAPGLSLDLRLPVTTLAITAHAPTVAQAGLNVALPTAELLVEALPPVVTIEGVALALPVIELTIEGVAPEVKTLGAVALPTTVLTIEGVAPAVGAVASDGGNLAVGLFPIDPLFLFPD